MASVEIYTFCEEPTTEEVASILREHYGPGEVFNAGFCVEADTEMEHLIPFTLKHDEEDGIWVLSFKSNEIKKAYEAGFADALAKCGAAIHFGLRNRRKAIEDVMYYWPTR